MKPPRTRRTVLLFLCLLLAFGAAAALVADALDGDADGLPSPDVSALLVDVTPLRPPAGTIRIPPSRPAARDAHALAPAPRSLRAPPAA